MGRRRDRDSSEMVSTPPDRIKHLEFLQTTIARQASHSFAIKGWSLTVAAALYAYTATHLTWWMAVVSLLPPTVFAGLDAYYLRQERLFRALYREVANPVTEVAMFDMNTASFANPSKDPTCRYWGKRGVLRSNTWRLLHGMIVAVGLLLLGVALFQNAGVTELAQCVSNIL